MEPHAYKTDGRRKAWNRVGRGEDGLSYEIKRLKPRDRRILSVLEKYPLLDSEHLFALCGGRNLKRFKERLRLLSDPPNEYIAWPRRQQYRANGSGKINIWGRTRRGTQALIDAGLPVNDDPYREYHDLFEHQYLCYATLASIEAGGAKVTMLHPPPIEVSISLGKEQKTFHYTPDAVARIDFPTGEQGYLQLENEKGNSVRRTNLEQPSFLRKLLAIEQIMADELYATEWGFPHLLTLIITPYGPKAKAEEPDRTDKLSEMKALVVERTEGRGLPYMLFNEVIGFDHPWKSFKPRPELFTGTWERTGRYAPFSLSTPPKLKGR